MRKSTLILITAFLLLIFAVKVQGQNNAMVNVNLSTALSVGPSKYGIDKSTLRGFSIELRKNITQQITIGGILGCNYFSKNTGNSTRQTGTTNIYGYENIYSKVMPFMLSFDYYFFKTRQIIPYNLKEIIPGMIRPYLGVDFGGFNFTDNYIIGNTSNWDNFWCWGVTPEIGVLIFLNKHKNAGINIGGKYNILQRIHGCIPSNWAAIDVGFTYQF